MPRSGLADAETVMAKIAQEAKPRLLLIEDDPQLGPLIAQVLADAYEVTLVADGVLGVEAALAADFDVMIVDRRLPSLDGLGVIETLRGKRVTTPMLMLTALGTVGDKVRGLDAGANDYLVKPFEFDELLARLRALRRVFTGEGAVVSIGQWEFYPESRAIYSPYNGRILLTSRETTLLQLLAENPQRTFSRHQILRAVFGSDDNPGTVDTYVHYLRRKTDVAIVTTVRGQGYRLGQL
ncbi:response regulator transcription factor [Lacisediminihabitans sp.]|uniref:response regulator transcription factor n=1 Tax=Lacisediminihabitans sp. TaxID=2787631 RepID=UPI002F92CDB7